MKTKEELIELKTNLKYYQMWRRGVDDRLRMPSPADISKWLYEAIEVIDECLKKEN